MCQVLLQCCRHSSEQTDQTSEVGARSITRISKVGNERSQGRGKGVGSGFCDCRKVVKEGLSEKMTSEQSVEQEAGGSTGPSG